MSPRPCLLCSSKNSSSYHRFPKDPVLKLFWMNICNLESTDDVSSIRICANHFSEDDFYIKSYRNGFGNTEKTFLKFGVVPSKNITRPLLPRYPTYVPAAVGASSGISNENTLKRGKQHFDGPVEKKSRTLEQNYTYTSPDFVTSHENSGTIGLMTFNEEVDIKMRNEEKIDSNQETIVIPDNNMQKIDKQRRKIRQLQQKNRRYVKKIETMKKLLGHLKSKDLISRGAYDHLMDNVPDNIKYLFERKGCRRNIKYSPELRKFAVTLQFYSTRAYNYVRKTFGNLLPHTSTIKKWYSVVDGNPGFSSEALKSLRAKNSESQVFLNIIIDEMAIRSQMIYHQNKFVGGVDLGANIENDNECVQQATSALVFMVVSINNNWKLPIGYCFINGLDAPERANLMKKCLELIQETGCMVTSLTFDGTSVNLAMCKELGACFTMGKNFKPFFINPFTEEKVFIFWDPCHMIKLVRNTIADKGLLMDRNNNKIEWEYFKQLNALQSEQGLNLANKLTKRHIFFNNNRMNVRLAVQTLSESVSNAFKYLEQTKQKGFENVQPTSEFCYYFNHMFDFLNCRNRFSKKNKYNIPLEASSEVFLEESAKEFESYIINLKDDVGKPILETKRFTGFLGMIICLRNVIELYKAYKGRGLKYLLTFKLTQDPLEMFFSAIRSRGGFNNNPNVLQFKTAFKRLLIKNEMKFFDGNSNCINDYLDILSVSSTDIYTSDPVTTSNNLIEINPSDHDYIRSIWGLNTYVEGVVEYMSGFVVKKIIKKNNCDICKKHLLGKESPLLIELKNRGKLLIPSKDVIELCKMTEKRIRQYIDILFIKKNAKFFIMTTVMKDSMRIFDSMEMTEHIKTQDILNNHKVQMIKLIIEYFIDIRFHYEAKLKNLEKDDYVRHKLTKLILFKNQ